MSQTQAHCLGTKAGRDTEGFAGCTTETNERSKPDLHRAFAKQNNIKQT
jgi:hypothetical protein